MGGPGQLCPIGAVTLDAAQSQIALLPTMPHQALPDGLTDMHSGHTEGLTMTLFVHRQVTYIGQDNQVKEKDAG